MNWFEVDKNGLSKIVSRKPKYFVLFELLQNAWDEDSKIVKLNISKEKNAKLADISIEDDNPSGFSNLTHSFTLFAESAKKSNPNKRGRFNLGEKLVLSLCHEASIESTTGTIEFNSQGRKKTKKKRNHGTIFKAKIKMTNQEVSEALEAINMLIPPNNIKTFINNVELEIRKPIKTFEMQLATELSNQEGFIKKTKRKSLVEVYVSKNNIGWIYELGIPIVETGDQYNINVMQKVPLNLERDNVNPAYLKSIRTGVLENTIEIMSSEDTTQNWVSDALSSKNINSNTVKELITKKYGDRAVIYDPSDSEANKLAFSQGYTVIHGRQLNKEQWENIRKSSAMLPAGQVTPSPKPFSDDPNAKILIMHERCDWNKEEISLIAKLETLSKILINKKVKFRIANDSEWGFNGSFSRGDVTMILNKAALGKKWFSLEITEDVLRLLIHELGHYYASDHLSSEYHDALCKLGSKIAFIDLNII
jgi:hypothetical protein